MPKLPLFLTTPIFQEGTLVDLKSITLPSMSLVTAHFDGTVNLFSFEMGVEDVTFTDMGNLVHEVRCSGHRFSFNDYYISINCSGLYCH